MTTMTITSDAEIEVFDLEFCKHGYAEQAKLLIQPGMGRWVATLWLLPESDDEIEEEREVAWEPSEPELQELAVQGAFNDPKGAILEAIEIDKNRRAELLP